MKYNCFTEFCCFLSNLDMNQPSAQFSSVAQSCPALCDPMNRSTPGLPVHHQFPEFTHSHVQPFVTPWTAAHQASLSSVQFSSVQFSSVQLLSRVQLFATPWIAARQAFLSITNSRSSLRLKSLESVMPFSHLILYRPLLLLLPIPSSIRVFSNESTLRMRWPKYWSFSFSIIPSKGISGLISFRMDWLDLLAVQGTLKSLLPTPQFKSINSSALSLLHSPTVTSIHDHWKTIALTRRTLVGKVMSLLLNILSRLVITFLPRSKRLLISWSYINGIIHM